MSKLFSIRHAARRVWMLALAVPLLTGCWDRLELEERAVVLGISVDTANPSEAASEDETSHFAGAFPVPGNELIRVAVQIALPGRIPLGPGEGGVGGDSARTVWVIDVVGHTLDDALMNLQQQVSGRLFYGHLRVIVVSEAVARRGLQNLNDYLRRNSEVRRAAWMIVAEGSAMKLMRASPELERVPTLYLLSTMDSAVKLGKLPVNYVGMYWSNSAKKGQEGFLPYVQMRKEQNVEVKGLAYFKSDKMLGATEPFEIAPYMSVKGINPAGYRGYVRIGDPEQTVMVFATSRKSKVDVSIRNGKPYFKVSIFTEINLEEKESEQFLVSNASVLRTIEEKDQKALAQACDELVEKTKKAGSDIFGFGEYLRAKQPGYWNREVRTKEGWQRIYPSVPVEIVVKSKIRRVGMKAK